MNQLALNFEPATERLSRQCAKLLERLRRGPVTGAEVVRELDIHRVSGRIYDLRQKGYRIDKKRLKDGLYLYWLIED